MMQVPLEASGYPEKLKEDLEIKKKLLQLSRNPSCSSKLNIKEMREAEEQLQKLHSLCRL